MCSLLLIAIVCSLHRYDHPHILSGQGTAGLEIADQVDNIDAIVIPVGGGGLLAGCAVALKTLCPNVMIIVSSLFLNLISFLSLCCCGSWSLSLIMITLCNPLLILCNLVLSSGLLIRAHSNIIGLSFIFI